MKDIVRSLSVLAFLVLVIAPNGSFAQMRVSLLETQQGEIVGAGGDLFRDIVRPVTDFFGSLQYVRYGVPGGENVPIRREWSDPRDVFLGADDRFRVVTGIGITQALKAVWGIAVWVFDLTVRFLVWLGSSGG